MVATSTVALAMLAVVDFTTMVVVTTSVTMDATPVIMMEMMRSKSEVKMDVQVSTALVTMQVS